METLKALPTRTSKRAVKCDVHQTNIELTLTLFTGINPKTINNKSFEVKSTETTCTVSYSNGEYWSCEFFRHVVPDGTSFSIKSNRIIIKLIKKTPENWETIFAKDGPKPEENMEELKKEEEDRVVQLPVCKYDIYEKNLETINVNVFLRLLIKNSLSIEFEEDKFVVKFKSSNSPFLNEHNANPETIFSWTVYVKEKILPARCGFKHTEKKIDILLTKVVPLKWSSLELVPAHTKASPAILDSISSSTWVPMSNRPTVGDSPTKCSPENGVIDPCVREEEKKEVSPKRELKPTCMVSPLNQNLMDTRDLAGLIGLENLGNTCFMNSVLQCLANTRDLKEYFLRGHYLAELNKENPLGMNGHLAVAFGVLLKVLWTGSQQSYAPTKLKGLISLKASQFIGYAQHDAQEFMAFFLDGLHEDLNRIKDKPYIENNSSENKSDEMAASEAWENYKKRNDSVVVSLFQGQYKSKLVCPICDKVSITFDPFLYLSLPLPKELHLYSVFFFSKDGLKKPTKYHVQLPSDAIIEEMRLKLSPKIKVAPKNLRVFLVNRQDELIYLANNTSLSNTKPFPRIFVFEVYDTDLVGEPVLELAVNQRLLVPPIKNSCSHCLKEPPMKLKRCTKCLNVAYCNVNCQRSHWDLHKSDCSPKTLSVGLPFMISIPQSQANYSFLSRSLQSFSAYSVNLFQPPLSLPSSASGGVLTNTSTTPSDCGDNLNRVPNKVKIKMDESDNQMPPLLSPSYENDKKSFMQETEKGMLDLELSDKSSEKEGPLQPVRIVIGQPTEEQAVQPFFQIKIVDKNGRNAQSAGDGCLKDLGQEPLKLTNCRFLSMEWKNDQKYSSYVLVQTKDEMDYEDDHSESGKETLDTTLDECLKLFTEPEVLTSNDAWYCPSCKEHREATKQLSLWRLPPVLIIQLKRFSYGGFLHYRDKIDKMIQFPLRNLNLAPYSCNPELSKEGPVVYDLYAVVNHQGGILGGHYTSFARCVDSSDSRRSEKDWRHFDDSHVVAVTESRIVTEAAYVLFYQRRGVTLSSVFHPPQESILEDLISQETFAPQWPVNSGLILDEKDLDRLCNKTSD